MDQTPDIWIEQRLIEPFDVRTFETGTSADALRVPSERCGIMPKGQITAMTSYRPET